MPVIPQITNPFQGKGYQSSLSNNQNRPGGEQFEIIQLTKPQSVSDSTERRGGKQQQLLPNRTDLPQLMVKTPKDPTMAVETLKQLISTELLATARANGYTELHGELEELSKSIYLQLGELVEEMINQEKQTTMFSGDRLFDLLRNLAVNNESPNTPQNAEKLTAIANFLKAVNFSFNRDEILNALSANLKFLSTYFSPSPPLSEKLAALAEAWGGIQARENFELLKSETVKLLHNVSESLLNNEKTQILIPLIIHNLSRYNTNDYMLKDSFSHLLTHVPHSHKGAFIAAFDDFLNAILYGNKAKESPRPSTNDTTDSKTNQSPVPEKGLFVSLYAQRIAAGDVFPPVGMTHDSLADGLRGFLLGKLSGMESINTILSNLITGMNDPSLFSALQGDLAKIDSITMLVNYLNDVLTHLPDVPERQTLFEMLSETVSGMAEKGELPPDSSNKQAAVQPEQPNKAESAPRSSLEELTAFIEKNINHNALKTLDSYNASNLLQSLINAPGVYTPLSHFIIPLQIGDMKAFGELWIDNENKGGGGTGGNDNEKHYHMFLTFEIEAVGRFETDLYAFGSEISLAVLHPESFSDAMTPLKEKISRIISSTDYSVKEFKTGVLRHPHDLTQIFPRIVEKRQGLDISI